jgi:hypothetical protein
LASAAALLTCSQETPRPEPSATAFREVAAEVGIEFVHFNGATGHWRLPEIMGAGVALLDYDGDGDLDIYLVQGAILSPDETLSQALFPPPAGGHPPRNRLFRNEVIPSGELRFTDVTGQAAVGDEGYGMGAAVGDYDNDGFPDIFVTNVGANVLYHNRGDGTFERVAAPGLDDPRWSTSAAWLDYDGDGDLDLFFANYVDFTVRNNKECFDSSGARDYCAPSVYRPVPDRLFRNDGGRFIDVTEPAGLTKAYGNGLGVVSADVNGDGLPDIVVANDGTANQLWIHRGDGTFEDTALMAGAAYNIDGEAEAGMGVSAADFDEDGDEDIFMTHLARETNTLWVNNGRGEFRDETSRWGLAAPSAPYTGFGMHWFDYDLDGWLDLFIANGAVTIEESLRGDPYPYRQRNQLFRRNREGRFEEVSAAAAGAAFELVEVGRGAAFGDLDLDGDIDIVVANNNGPARVLLNLTNAPELSVRARLIGSNSNRDAAGARVALVRGGRPARWRRVGSDGSYLSASELTVTFGLGDDTTFDGLGVVWPGGRRELFSGMEAGRTATLREGEGEPWP